MGKNAWIFVTDRGTWIDCAKDGSYGLKRAPGRIKEAESDDPLVAYIQKESLLAGLGHLTSLYYFDPDNEEYPHRVRLEVSLDFDNAIDVRSIIDRLSFVKDKAHWPVHFKGGAVKISLPDFEIIKAAIRRKELEKTTITKPSSKEGMEEKDLYKTIISMPELVSSSLHDRIAEMIHVIGLRMGYDSIERYHPAPDSPYQIDIAWLQNKNPQIAIEVHYGGVLGDAIDRLRHARDFNFRKVVLVIVKPEEDIRRTIDILKFDDKLKHVIDLWSVESIYSMYSYCNAFYELYNKFQQSVYKKDLESTLF